MSKGRTSPELSCRALVCSPAYHWSSTSKIASCFFTPVQLCNYVAFCLEKLASACSLQIESAGTQGQMHEAVADWALLLLKTEGCTTVFLRLFEIQDEVFQRRRFLRHRLSLLDELR